MYFVYDVPDAAHRHGPHAEELYANFESEETIAALLDHARPYVDLEAVNIRSGNWVEKVGGGPVFNYTYGFGLLEESIHTTLTLESLGVDYRGAPPLGIYLSANKPYCSALLRGAGFECPRERLICLPFTMTMAENACRYFGEVAHLITKPAYEESSVGLVLCHNEPHALWAVVNALQASLAPTIVIQEYVEGFDVTVPIIGQAKPLLLPALVLQRDDDTEPFVFSAAAKATKHSVHYEPLSDWWPEAEEMIRRMARTAFALTRQRDYSRVDARLTRDGRCVFLEINANPQLGLGKASFAVAARAAGLELGQIMAAIMRHSPDDLDEASPVVRAV